MPKVQCPKCAAELRAPAEYKGRKVKCKKCGRSFVLRFSSRKRPVVTDPSTRLDFDLAGRPSKKRLDGQLTRSSNRSGQPFSLKPEPWRAAIYQRVTDERFNGNFASFARAALDALAEQLGYAVRPTEPKPAD